MQREIRFRMEHVIACVAMAQERVIACVQMAQEREHHCGQDGGNQRRGRYRMRYLHSTLKPCVDHGPLYLLFAGIARMDQA